MAGVYKSGGSYYAGAVETDATNRIQYAPQGATSVMKLGNNKWEHANFNSRLQPTQIGLGTSGTDSSLLRLDFSYGSTTNNGNMLTQTIVAPNLNRTQTYSYDELNRLTKATEETPATPPCVLGDNTKVCQEFMFDRFGNRWVSLGLIPLASQTPTSVSSFNQATNRLANGGYDNVGNLTSYPVSQTFTYDAENRQVNFNTTDATLNTAYSYNGDGRRVKTVRNGITTVFVYNGAGQLAAEYSSGTPGSSGTSYLTTDHLGSTRIVTDSSGNAKVRRDYLPFGEEIAASLGGRSSVPTPGYGATEGTRQKFTAKERDSESNLDYFGARYFSGAQGRFTSPDNPRFALATDPQTWNLYAYVRNATLNKVDPDGRNWFLIDGRYEWHEGDTYKEHTAESSYTHLLVFEKTGRNREGAVVGTLKLYDQNRVVGTANAFSGGGPFNPIPDGRFMVRLDIRDRADSVDDLKANRQELKQFYGIQEIAPQILDRDGSLIGNARWEWGSIRAALNEEPGETRSQFQGNYLHGKQRQPRDYTHGCICDRSEIITNILLGLDPKQVPKVPVEVKAGGR